MSTATQAGVAAHLDGPLARSPVVPPDPATPWWRNAEGRRESLGSLRSGLNGDLARALGEHHVEAIAAIARAAIEAAERGERAEARRLAHAASRLCEETIGRWPPSAVETPHR